MSEKLMDREPKMREREDHNKYQKDRRAFERSPEGKQGAEENKRLKKEAQQKIDALMEQLPNLDFTNQEAVLDWICAFQPLSDDRRVRKDPAKVLEIFARHNYQPNVNMGKSFNENDRDIFARYIVGCALQGLQGKVGVIPRVVHQFTDQWKHKFASKS